MNITQFAVQSSSYDFFCIILSFHRAVSPLWMKLLAYLAEITFIAFESPHILSMHVFQHLARYAVGLCPIRKCNSSWFCNISNSSFIVQRMKIPCYSAQNGNFIDCFICHCYYLLFHVRFHPLQILPKHVRSMRFSQVSRHIYPPIP